MDGYDGYVLRHGHPVTTAGSNINWHIANVVHGSRANSNAVHTIHASYDHFTSAWNNSGIHISSSQKSEFIRRAKSEHDALAAAKDAGEVPPVKIEAPSKVDVTNSQGAASTTDVEVLNNRIDNVESLVAINKQAVQLALQGATEADGKVAATKKSVEEFTVKQAAEMSLHTKRIDDIEKKVAATVTIVHSFTFNDGKTPIVLNGEQHYKFDKLVRVAKSLDPNQRNIWMAGPAGSGKTTAAENLAKVLFGECKPGCNGEGPGDDECNGWQHNYRYQGASSARHDLAGFMGADAKTYHMTNFRYIFEHGGVMLLDEVDASFPVALMEINAALANAVAAFPDKMVKRHARCWVLAAANTVGLGGDAKYSARMKQDAAFIDRFMPIHWDYDNNLENKIVGPDYQDLARAIQQCRVNADSDRSRADIVISPRSTFRIAALMRGGLFTRQECVDSEFADRYRASIQTFDTIFKPAIDWAKAEQPVKSSTDKHTLSPVNFDGVRVFGRDR